MKKLFALMIVICVMLTGCRLATDDVNEDGLIHTDRLVGVVVTTEYLDLFDMEAFLRDKPEELMKGGVIDTRGYEGRIYAQEKIEESTTQDGVPCTTTRYNFDHLDGVQLLYYQVQTILEDGTVLEDFTSGRCSEGILAVAYRDDLTEGTIYVPKDAVDVTFYTNPVYQDTEGRLYLMAGQGISCQNMVGSMSQTITEEYTESYDGEETTFKREFKITVEGTTVPDKVAIVQMSGENAVLDRQEFKPENLPETLTPVDGCAYILVEEYTGDELKRTMIVPDNSYLSVFIRTEKLYCSAKGTTILWPEK